MQLKHLIAVLIPPSGCGVKGIYPLADIIRIFWGELSGIEPCNDTDESCVTLDVVAPMILTQAEAENIVKLSYGARQLDVSHHMRLRLLVQESVVTMTLYVS